jgi:twitching motility protein PilT
MEQALATLVVSGTISLEEGLSKSARPDELQRLVGGAAPAAASVKTKAR